MESQQVRILFAGGGTGGHLFPALAIADEIRNIRSDAVILFVGTKKRIEARVVPAQGYAFRTVWISGFHRGLRLSNLLFPVKFPVSMIQSFLLIRSFKPQVVVGTGGYVAGPVLLVASLSKIPTVVHESNSLPGLTTKLLSRRATKVLITFDATRRWLKRQDNVELVGNPTRRELGMVSRENAARFFKLDPEKRTVLVFGGSLGAASINRAVSDIVDDLVNAEIQLIWQTGEREYDAHPRRTPVRPSVWMGPFIDRMDCAYSASDLVVCRAGATTLAELTRLGKPAILVPYPHAAANHQVINARTLVDAGAAQVVYDHDLAGHLKAGILNLISNPDTLRRMGEASEKLGRPEAGRAIAEKILEIARV